MTLATTTQSLNLLVTIGGLAAAYVLGRGGHAVTVLEQAGATSCSRAARSQPVSPA